MRNKRFEITMSQKLFDDVDAYCKKHKIKKTALVNHLVKKLLDDDKTDEADETVNFMLLEKGQRAIIKKIARQSVEFDILRGEVREAMKGLEQLIEEQKEEQKREQEKKAKERREQEKTAVNWFVCNVRDDGKALDKARYDKVPQAIRDEWQFTIKKSENPQKTAVEFRRIIDSIVESGRESELFQKDKNIVLLEYNKNH